MFKNNQNINNIKKKLPPIILKKQANLHISEILLLKNNNLNNNVNNNNNNILKLKKIIPMSKCLNAFEYYSQFGNINLVKYDLIELKSSLIKITKILKTYDIFIVNTNWDTVWNNDLYSIDHAEELICAQYFDMVKWKFENYKKYYIGRETRYNVPILYLKNFISYIPISDFDYYKSKNNGFLTIYPNIINLNEKNIIERIFKETFNQRFNLYENTINISLIKI